MNKLGTSYIKKHTNPKVKTSLGPVLDQEIDIEAQEEKADQELQTGGGQKAQEGTDGRSPGPFQVVVLVYDLPDECPGEGPDDKAQGDGKEKPRDHAESGSRGSLFASSITFRAERGYDVVEYEDAQGKDQGDTEDITVQWDPGTQVGGEQAEPPQDRTRKDRKHRPGYSEQDEDQAQDQ